MSKLYIPNADLALRTSIKAHNKASRKARGKARKEAVEKLKDEIQKAFTKALQEAGGKMPYTDKGWEILSESYIRLYGQVLPYYKIEALPVSKEDRENRVVRLSITEPQLITIEVNVEK